MFSLTDKNHRKEIILHRTFCKHVHKKIAEFRLFFGTVSNKQEKGFFFYEKLFQYFYVYNMKYLMNNDYNL